MYLGSGTETVNLDGLSAGDSVTIHGISGSDTVNIGVNAPMPNAAETMYTKGSMNRGKNHVDYYDATPLVTKIWVELVALPSWLLKNNEEREGNALLFFLEVKMDQKFVDAITNVRLVSGTIRIDLMNITGQTDDNKLQFAKTGELILSQQAFVQALNTMNEVDAEIKKRNAAAEGSEEKN